MVLYAALANNVKNFHCKYVPQNASSPEGRGPTSNKCFRGPKRVHIPNGIAISSAIFAGLMEYIEHINSDA